MCSNDYILRKERAVQKSLDDLLNLTEDQEGQCIMGTFMEAELCGELIFTYIRYLTTLRWKMIRRAGDESMTLPQVEKQVRDELLAKLRGRLKESMLDLLDHSPLRN